MSAAVVQESGSLAAPRSLPASRSHQSLADLNKSPAYAQHAANAPSATGSLAPSASQPANLSAMLPQQSITASYVPTSAAPSNSYSSSAPSSGAAMPLATKPAVVEYGNYRFCIHDAPTNANLPSYVDFLTRKRTVALVRACEPTYDKSPLLAAGIRVVELPFQDGSPPPDAMITHWLALVNEVFGPPSGGGGKDKEKAKDKSSKDAAAANGEKSPKGNAIAVHCVAGLGRAPVLVCIALIEAGMNWMTAVELVRKKRRGALNITQLKYLETYKPRGKKDNCVIM